MADPNYLNDDENVRAMRETAREIGLTQLMLAIAKSHYTYMGQTDITKLEKVLDLLGVTSAERNG